MPADEIAEGVVRLGGRIAYEVFVHLVFEVVCYGVGFVVLRVFTVNRYPPAPLSERSINVCQWVGLASLVSAFATAALLL